MLSNRTTVSVVGRLPARGATVKVWPAILATTAHQQELSGREEARHFLSPVINNCASSGKMERSEDGG